MDTNIHDWLLVFKQLTTTKYSLRINYLAGVESYQELYLFFIYLCVALCVGDQYPHFLPL